MSPPDQGPPHITNILAQTQSQHILSFVITCAGRRCCCSFLHTICLPQNKASTTLEKDQNSRNGLLGTLKSAEGDKQKNGYLLIKILSLFPAGYHLSNLEQYVKWHSGLEQTSKNLSFLCSRALSCAESYTPGTILSFSKY